MNPTQAHALRDVMGVKAGEEWEPLAGLAAMKGRASKRLLDRTRIAREKRVRSFGQLSVPAIPAPHGDEQSTQAAFGRILLDLAKSGHPLADRIVTTSPDVTVSTNLGAFVNQRGLFKRREMKMFLPQQRLHQHKNGRRPTMGSTSSLALRNPTCS
jgi:pyruvate dehydrogenase E1 component